ncbi:MAG TPA: hypothetical protein VHZ81_14105 [Galbitalea sp.]|jgi:hypothetical protein|nr:hypothetical protein [Galbitalea sp.]
MAVGRSSNKMDAVGEVVLRLTAAEALVLFGWLYRAEKLDRPAACEDEAERVGFCDMNSMLESVLVAQLRDDYAALLAAARTEILGSHV